jgi:hypothetical protein
MNGAGLKRLCAIFLAGIFLPESKDNVKSDGQECPSYTNKTKVKSPGRVARVRTVGSASGLRAPGLSVSGRSRAPGGLR